MSAERASVHLSHRASERELRILPVEGLPEFGEGMAVGEEIAARVELRDGDVIVISQKVVSKAEGRIVHLHSAIPGAEARRLAAVLGKDPALVELILAESRHVIRAERSVLIVETHHGLVCANAGIDSSNLPEGLGRPPPRGPGCLGAPDPGRDRASLGRRAAVVVSDSFGRAWRLGQAEVAIGCAGLVPLDDWRGREDSGGRALEATQIAVADEAAAAADLVRDKASGFRPSSSAASAVSSPRRTAPAPPRCAALPTRTSSARVRRTAAPRREPLRIESSASLAPLRGWTSISVSTGASAAQREELLAVAPGQVGDRAQRRAPPRGSRRERRGCRSCGCRR